ATQEFLLLPDGSIRYLNTAGFAVRRSYIEENGNLFDERLTRGEDTLLLATLMQRDQLPLFMQSATISHALELSAWGYLLKALRTSTAEAQAYSIMATMGVNVRMNYRQRWQLLSRVWKISNTEPMGRLACMLLVARQTLRLVIFALLT